MYCFMKFKKSRFCVLKEFNNTLILANIRTGYIIKFLKDHSFIVKELLDGVDYIDKDDPKNKIFEYFIEHGFLVDASIDEEETEKLEIEKIKNNNGYLSFIILPTDDCNFRCQYCYEDHEKRRMSISYLDLIARFVDKNIDKYKGLKVEWFGGEPLLVLESIYYLSQKFKDICKLHKKPFISCMTTNGYYLTVDVFEKLRKLHFTGYQITLDGFASSHDKQRYLANGMGTWDVIVNNLRAIRDTPCKGFTNITIRSNFTIGMLETAKDFIDFLKNEFGHDRRFDYFIRTVADFGGDRINNMRSQMITENKVMYDIQKYASSIGLNLKVQKNGLYAGGMICYANQRNYYVLGSDRIVRKSTCEYNNPLNHIGFIDEDGNMVINKAKENIWVNGYSCENDKCSHRITCCGDGCPRNHLIYNNKSCVWNACSLEKLLEILSYNENAVPVYN